MAQTMESQVGKPVFSDDLKRPAFINLIVALILVLSAVGCLSGLSKAGLAYNDGVDLEEKPGKG